MCIRDRPWDPAVLLATARKLLTRFIMDKGIDHMPYMSCLDQGTLLDLSLIHISMCIRDRFRLQPERTLTLGTVSLYQCHNRLDGAARPAGSGPLQRCV